MRGCVEDGKQRKRIDKTVFLLLYNTYRSTSTHSDDCSGTIPISKSVDVPGAYLQTDLDEKEVFVKFEGKIANILKRIDPKM